MASDPSTIQPQRRETRPRQPPAIQVLFSPASGLVVGSPRALRSGSNPIGRSPSLGGFAIDDPAVSRLHVVIEVAERGLTLEDQSTHGTFCWGKRVHQHELSLGDILRIGDSLLIVRHDESEIEMSPPVEGLLGEAPAIRELRRSIRLVATDGASVLLCGETGTGKEVVARAIHDSSGVEGAFVAVNCGAIPESLAESHLFGHVKGAFTGATQDHNGFFLQADGGTLFLDEVGELLLPLQPKLLRALEAEEITPIGGVKSRACRPRIIAASNRNFEQAVEGGSFRRDLHARLSDITLSLPPLRQRREDIIPILASVLPQQLAPPTPNLVEALLIHPWPGNVRELLKVGNELTLRGVGQDKLRLSLVEGRLNRPRDDIGTELPKPTAAVPAPDRDRLVELLTKHGGNISQIARVTGRSRRQVRRYLETYGLNPEDFRDS